MKESARKILMVFMAVGFLCGLAILLYPLFANKWNAYNANLKFQEYQIEATENKGDESLVDEWAKAYAYNDQLQPIIIPDSFIQAEGLTKEDTLYSSCLNTKGDGMMGYISIPKIGQNIPIYHTAAEEVLQKGAGHVQGSSLPVGGESSHAAISAHRGLPGQSLFTDLDQLKEGDQFYLYILDDILAYEVDQILVVEPHDTEALSVVDGKDYVTLITCTPYGVNSHRMLVRGHRVPYEEEQVVIQQQQEVHSVHTNYVLWIVLGLLASFLVTAILVIVIKLFQVRTRRKQKEKQQDRLAQRKRFLQENGVMASPKGDGKAVSKKKAASASHNASTAHVQDVPVSYVQTKAMAKLEQNAQAITQPGAMERLQQDVCRQVQQRALSKLEQRI